MYKAIISGVAGVVLFMGAAASAQVYTSNAYSCVQISRDLSVGSRGSDVTSLQTFLVSQNYPGGGSWMITGYYGAATQAAVRNFQAARNLPQSGVVDSATRAALGNCGSSYGMYPYTYNYQYSNPTYPYGSYQYPYQQYPYQYANVSISSLSSTSVTPGSSVTIYGSGFDYTNNTVYVGSMPVSYVQSSSNTSLTFTVPQMASGSYQVYVTNSRGTSNALTLTVNNYGSWYGQPGGCAYYGCPSGQLSLSYLNPSQGAVGSTVTIYGSGFSTTGNTVRFGNGIISNIGSVDGRAVTFTVPSQLTGYGSQQVYLGTYNVSVTNASGMTSNSLPFTVTSLGSMGAPQITSVAGPTTLQTGVSGTWTVTVNSPSYTNTTLSVQWGDEHLFGSSYLNPQSTSIYGSQTFTFNHAYQHSGTYTITFTATNSQGQQNTSTVTVTVSGSSTGQIALNSITPQSGRTGTQVVLQGSGFSQYGNLVHFGSGGSRDVVSFNGNTIFYTIPAWISPCDPSAQFCTAQAIAVTPGTYPMYVTNASGQHTGTIYFTVTN